jgi:hypothetical protein
MSQRWHIAILPEDEKYHKASSGLCHRVLCEAIRRSYNFTVVARLDRAIQYAAAYRFNHCCLWNTGSPAFAGDDSKKHSRGAMRPEF